MPGRFRFSRAPLVTSSLLFLSKQVIVGRSDVDVPWLVFGKLGVKRLVPAQPA
jgi:hypothetical protein